jgi:hypothetical protein
MRLIKKLILFNYLTIWVIKIKILSVFLALIKTNKLWKVLIGWPLL